MSVIRGRRHASTRRARGGAGRRGRCCARSSARRSSGWRATACASGLSMLGISWGIVSVVMLLAYGEGFNQALLRGFQGAFGDGVSIVFAGQTSMQSGGERAGKRIRMRLADAEAVGADSAREGVEPGVLAATSPWRGGRSRRPISPAAWRRPTGTCGRSVPAAGRFIDAEDVRLQRRVGVPRQRGGAEAVRQLAAGRRDRAHQRHGLRRGRRAEGEGPALQLQPSRQGERVHPLHDGRAAVEHRVPQHARSIRRWIRRSARGRRAR